MDPVRPKMQHYLRLLIRQADRINGMATAEAYQSLFVPAACQMDQECHEKVLHGAYASHTKGIP